MNSSKSLLLIIAIAFTTIISSCKKEEDASIIGKWELTQYGTISNGLEVLEDAEYDCPTKKTYIKFEEGSIVKSQEYDENCEGEGEAVGSWTKSGASLTVTFPYDTEPQNATILKLDNSTLKLKVDDTNVQVYQRAS